MVVWSWRWSSTSSTRGLGSQLGVEVRQRLVHQEDLGPADDRSGQRHPLTLAARQRSRLAIEQVIEPEDAGGVGHPLVAFGLVELAGRLVVDDVGPGLERDLDVLAHGHVRVERIALEHHGDVAVLGLDVVDHLVADLQGAVRHGLEAGDHAQRRRLPAARRAQQHHELLVDDVEGQRIDRHDLVEPLRDPVEPNRAHRSPPRRERSARRLERSASSPRGTARRMA